MTGFYQGRYSNIIMQSFPANWTPNSVILEGMFLIHTKPCHKTMADYGKFLMNRFITPHFKKGCTEVHLLFDDPGQQQENSKQFEQSRRDHSEMAPEHLCTIFFDDAEVPTKWQQNQSCITHYVIFQSLYKPPHHVSFLVEFCITDPEEGLSIRPKRRKID